MSRLVLLAILVLAAPRPAAPAISTIGITPRGETTAPVSGTDERRTPAMRRTPLSPAPRLGVEAPATPRADAGPSRHLRGIASWYRVEGMVAAAGPELRRWLGDWRGRHVRVCAQACVTVRLTDWCQCYRGTKRERLLDLSDRAFQELAPLPVGLVRVTVSAVALPRTDTE